MPAKILFKLLVLLPLVSIFLLVKPPEVVAQCGGGFTCCAQRAVPGNRNSSCLNVVSFSCWGADFNACVIDNHNDFCRNNYPGETGSLSNSCSWNPVLYCCPGSVSSDFNYNFSCPWDIYNPFGFECVQGSPSGSTSCGYGLDRFTGGFGCVKYDQIASCFPNEGGCVVSRAEASHFSSDCFEQVGPCGGAPPTPPPPPPPSCSCGSWIDGICGGGSCPANHMSQTRTCSPGGCSTESRCVADVSCGCDCGAWIDVGCGAGTCGANEMYQTRTCAPAACSVEERCDSGNPACTAASCTINIDSVVLNGPGDTFDEIVDGITETGGFIETVDFFSSDPSVVTVSPDIPPGPAFITTLTGQSIGGAVYSALAIMDDGVTTCQDSAGVSVGNPVGWWQVKEGDVVTNGSIFSDVPAGCVLPGCDPVFITEDAGEYPGVASHDGSYGSGTVSSTNWLAANSNYASAQTYDYTFFEAKIPSSVIPVDPGLTLDIADVTTGALGSAGYYWFQTSAATDLQITNPGAATVGSNKVIVFVDGNLTIKGRIPVNDGTGSFLVVVSRDIIIDPSVGGPQEVPTPLPDLEGIYITDGTFNTGTNGLGTDLQLHVRGSVAAPQGTINFQRELTDNSLTPGEIFEYGADQAIFFHPDLVGVRTIWREVAP